MPARDDHLNQAQHNGRFYSSIDKKAFKDWAVTVLFYTGLHYIDAFLADKRNIHPSKHGARDNAVATVVELRPIFADYSALKNASFNARYVPPVRYTDGYVSNLETHHLARIRAEIAKYISI